VNIDENAAKKTDGVIIAAGFSSRAGAFKMELDCHGKPLIQRTADAMAHACSRIIVVGGFRIERIRELTKDYPNLRVVLNPDYPSGMFGSVQRGVKEVESDWFFFIPGDYPLVTPEVYQTLLSAIPGHPEASVFIPVFKQRKGHPILLKGSLKKEILSQPTDSNLRQFIQQKGFIPVPVQSDSILKDIDTPRDYESLNA
jgi:molybdenum cofactor cytidylyltransferase